MSEIAQGVLLCKLQCNSFRRGFHLWIGSITPGWSLKGESSGVSQRPHTVTYFWYERAVTEGVLNDAKYSRMKLTGFSRAVGPWAHIGIWSSIRNPSSCPMPLRPYALTI